MASPVGSKDLVFRKICTERVVRAILYSVALQYCLMMIFLLFVNFTALHPIEWITDTICLLLSFYTWLVLIPIAFAVMIHGRLLAKPSLMEARFYPTHCKRWYHDLMQRSILLISNGTTGCLTAWMYTRFLRDDYQLLFLRSEDQTSVLNDRFLYLILCGLFSGCYSLTRGDSNPDVIEFRIVLLRKSTQFSNSFYSILWESMKSSFSTSLIYIVFYSIFSMLFRYKIAWLLGSVYLQEISILYNFYSVATDIRLLLYTWLLISLIQSNMNQMHALFHIFLAEPEEFTIETSALQKHTEDRPLLAEALAYKNIPLVQHLAAEDLFVVADTCESDRRKQLYQLTNPGGHPKNWRTLCDTCIKLICDFTHDLAQSIEGIELKPPPSVVMMGGILRPTTSIDRERILMRQYNQNFGVRNLSTPSFGRASGNLYQPEPVPEQKKFDNVTFLSSALRRLPWYDYFFEECKTAKTYYLLSVQSQLIVKITQSLSAIVSRSLKEDQYGVVQNDIPCIIHSLLELKKVVDKMGSINIDVKKIDRRYLALKGAVKRSLYRFTIAFKPYIKDLVLEPMDLYALQGFLNFHEV